MYGHVCKSASARFKGGHAPTTSEAHNSKFRSFIAFTIFMNKNLTSIDVWLVLSFLEFLVYNKKSFATVSNTLSALKTQCQLHGLDSTAFLDKRVSMFIKSPKNSPLCPVTALQVILQSLPG